MLPAQVVKVSVHINAPDEAEQEALTTKLNEKLADAEAATKALKVKVVGEISKAKIVHPKKKHAPGARARSPAFGANGPSKKPAFENGKEPPLVPMPPMTKPGRPDGKPEGPTGPERPTPDGKPEKYNCLTKEEWAPEKTKWCCVHGMGNRALCDGVTATGSDIGGTHVPSTKPFENGKEPPLVPMPPMTKPGRPDGKPERPTGPERPAPDSKP